jgi:heme exporter protein D
MTGQTLREARLTEAQFQKKVTDLCDWLRLKWHHETDSRRSKSGFPDLVIAGPTLVIFAELKTETGRVSPAQQEWLDILTMSGTPAYVWTPSDWPVIERMLTALAKGSL